MIRLVLKVAVYFVAIWLAVQVVDGLDFVGDTVGWLLVTLVMAAVNAIVKPVAKFLSFPVILLTLGLFLLIINVVMFFLVVSISEGLDLGLTSQSAGATIVGAIIVSVVAWVGEIVVPDGD